MNQEKAFETVFWRIQRAIQDIGGWQRLCSATDKEWDFWRKDFLNVYEEFEIELKTRVITYYILHRLQKEILREDELESWNFRG